MKRAIKLRRETIRILRDLRPVVGGRIGLSEVIGGCTKNTDGFCNPGPATDTNGAR